MKRLIALCVLISSPCYADYYSTKYYAEWGLAFDHKNQSSYDQTKFFEAGIHKPLDVFESQYSLGFWTDKSQEDGAKPSAYIQALYGLETRFFWGTYFSYKFGPAVLSQPDTLLGSYFQVSHELEIGYHDRRNVRLAMVVKHFSDAGLSKNNEGRNFLGIKAEF